MLMLRRVLVGAVAAVVTALIIGIPTGIIETPWYQRMTLNRPGSGGGSQPLKDESHVCTEEVQRRVA